MPTGSPRDRAHGRKIIYIAGFGRSGSTLVERLLASVDGGFAVGELCFFGDRVLAHDTICSCGEPPARCRLWSDVLRRLDAAMGLDELGRRLSLFSAFGALRGSTVGMSSLLRPRLRADRKVYLEALRTLYDAVFETTGARVLVDSSKYPSYGRLLAELFDVSVVHVVRDPRAAAYAWSKKVVYARHPDGSVTYMRRHSPLGSALRWSVYNLGASALGRAVFPRYVLIRYEDLARDPMRLMAEVARGLGETLAPDLFSDATTAVVEPGHQVAGNPMRFHSGPLRIREDRAWRAEMPWWQRGVVGVATAPLAWSYGYRPV